MICETENRYVYFFFANMESSRLFCLPSKCISLKLADHIARQTGWQRVYLRGNFLFAPLHPSTSHKFHSFSSAKKTWSVWERNGVRVHEKSIFLMLWAGCTFIEWLRSGGFKEKWYCVQTHGNTLTALLELCLSIKVWILWDIFDKDISSTVFVWLVCLRYDGPLLDCSAHQLFKFSFIPMPQLLFRNCCTSNNATQDNRHNSCNKQTNETNKRCSWCSRKNDLVYVGSNALW